MSEMDVVERIDELAAEEKCWHCDRSWHRLPLTQTVARMFDAGRFDADYFTRDDISPIVCDGSTFIGPLRPQPRYTSVQGSWKYSQGGYITWSGSIIIGGPDGGGAEPAYLTITPNTGILNMPVITWPKWDLESLTFNWSDWLGPKEPEPVCAGPIPEVDVEFGPQNWLPPQEPVHVPDPLKTKVWNRWNEFTKPEPIPVPASPGYDFTAYNCDEPKYPTNKRSKRNEGIRAPSRSTR